jgi:putative phosphoribosyl transferase
MGPVLEVEIGAHRLPGSLAIPDHASGLVIFAPGGRPSRRSARTVHVAERLRARGLATLVFDLLTRREVEEGENALDAALLADHLGEAVSWARADARLGAARIGLFGANSGAAAAIIAAADRSDDVGAVVCRGGRLDLAGGALERVRAPTMLIVGGMDHATASLNAAAARRPRSGHPPRRRLVQRLSARRAPRPSPAFVMAPPHGARIA